MPLYLCALWESGSQMNSDKCGSTPTSFMIDNIYQSFKITRYLRYIRIVRKGRQRLIRLHRRIEKATVRSEMIQFYPLY